MTYHIAAYPQQYKKDEATFPNQVIAINWEAFTRGQPEDELSIMERDILLNANRYCLTTWYSLYLDTGREAREAASQGLALAVSIKTGIYDAAKTGVSLNHARGIALKLISSVALDHKANDPGGWGNSWQSALAASYGGLAGWIMWDDLSMPDKEHIRKMVEYEANRFNHYKVPYYKDATGKVIYKGDTKSEENSWNATILHVAAAMMPHHANRHLWMNKNIELMLSANARPEDMHRSKAINGKRLDKTLKGSNYNSNGTVTNHGIVHPDYMTCTSHTFFNALVFTLALMPTPKAAFFNADLIYDALVDLDFPASRYAPPGGTMYVKNSGAIYYPQNTDWGTGRRMCFALMDCQMSAFGMDKLASKKGDHWEKLHAQEVLTMQSRAADGRTYGSDKEDSFGGREEWVAAHAAQAYLTKWLLNQGRFRVTNRSY